MVARERVEDALETDSDLPHRGVRDVLRPTALSDDVHAAQNGIALLLRPERLCDVFLCVRWRV